MSFRNLATAMAVMWMACLLSPAQDLLSQEKTPPRFVTSVQGVTITEEELNRAAAPELEKLELQKLQADATLERNRYQLRVNAFLRLVEDRLLNAEAARLKISVAQLIAGEVDAKVKDPTDQEVEQFYEKNKANITIPREQALPRIRPYMKQQSQAKIRGELIERLKKAAGVSYSIEPMRVHVETAGFAARGPADARVTIVEFSDFQCGYCKAANATLAKLMQNHGTSVRLIFRQFPLSEIHPLATKAAQAALCAGEQKKFWEMHDQMFQDQGKLGVPDLKATAARLNLDGAAFNSCLDSDRYADRIKRDMFDGAKVGITGTPAFFINGRFLNGAQPYEEMAKIVDEELKPAAKAQ